MWKSIFSIYYVLLLFCVIYFSCVQGVNASDCTTKTVKTGTVCVCDVKSCDEVPALDVTMGQGALYTTSHSGYRLHRDVVYPTDNEPFGTLHVTIDSSKKYQEMVGFGATFSDATGANLKSLPDKLADTVIRQYFSPGGLGFTLGRVPIASSDFSTNVYSYNDVSEDFSMQNFNLTTEDSSWKIPYIKSAMSYSNNRLKLIGVPWSAPGWMKTTKQMAGYGALNGKAGDNYHQAYALYIQKFLQAYNQQGLPFWTVSVQNEPTNGSNKKYKPQTTLFTAETQRDFIRSDLGPILRSSPDTKNVSILILDDNRNNLPGWADTVLKDEVAAEFVSVIGVHSYDDSASDGHLDKTHTKHPGVFILGTEASQGYKEKDSHVVVGSWDRAQSYASDIIDDMNNWVSGWMERNLILDQEGGPSWVPDYTDAPIIAVPSTASIYKQPMWYAIGQFSKFIQPGAYRIDHSYNVIELEVKCTAFLNPDGSKVLILLNTGSITAHTIVLRDSADSYNHYQFHLPTKSITTLYIQN
ncbi:unnamed protein product [Caenorhabditis angaria]|uniref:Glucosylceramidase n=1 Tax=Caenorhabditis angaria TaxID=860376 RepID=A0A9P1MWX9_9PELO|nr:unnamed protein product [Caenorhabditis angaria]